MIKKFFLKRLKNYFALTMIPTLFLLLFLFVVTIQSKVDTLSDTSQNVLININEKFDLVVTNAFYQNDLMTLNPQLSLSLQKILLSSAPNYTDYIFLNSMQTILDSISKAHPYIHSLYLYLDNYDNFLSSEKGICSLEGYYDTSWHSTYTRMSDDSSNQIEQRTIPSSYSTGEQEAITIYQPMTYVDGVIVANILTDTFLKHMEAAIPDWDNMLFILNGSYDVLLSNQVPEDALPAFRNYWSETGITQSDRAHRWIQINKSLYLFNTSYNDEYGIHFLLLTPFHSIVNNVLKDISWYLLVLLVNCVLVFILSLATTMRNFRQIQYVIQLFSDAENGILPDTNPDSQKVANEYDLIMNNVIRLFLNTTFLNSQLAEQKYKKQAAELAALQLQINPHFMINTLQTLNFEVYKLTDKPTAINHIIDNLSDILKYSLSSCDSPVCFSDELENIRKYVEIQKYRFPDSFLVYYDVEEEVLKLPFKRLILQPLVENSITHGIRSASRYGYVKIRITLRDDTIMVSVIDNGLGMPALKLTEIRENLSSCFTGSSIGLSNVNQRLILNYGAESALHIQSREGRGTCVSFLIRLQPLITKP